MATTIGTATEKGKAQAEELAQQPKGERKPQRQRRDDKFKIFSGTANEALADEICNFLGMPRAQAHLTRFSDGEVYVQILENVRGADVFVVQPTCFPVDQHLLELLLMIDALKRASARRITPVIPYFGYARQDRKDKPRVAISAKLVADLLTTAGAHRALVVDLHAPQIQGYFNIPVDHLLRPRCWWITSARWRCLILRWCHRMRAAWNAQGLWQRRWTLRWPLLTSGART